MNKYLASTEHIDWSNPEILLQAKALAKNTNGLEEITQNCFEFVRDQIRHSSDYALNPVTCKASDVLRHRAGFCYAKSHLLAALLRANKIPAGLCYQRLTTTDVPPYCLHGLNAVYIEQYGWCRLDARGNKPGISTEFCPPRESLAYATTKPGEVDLPEIWSEPLPIVIEALDENKTYQEVSEALPDIEMFQTKKVS